MCLRFYLFWKYCADGLRLRAALSQRWCPQLRAVRLHTSDKAECDRLCHEVLARPDSFDVAVTTYEMAMSTQLETALRTRITWSCLILDEGHRVKNELAATTQCLRRLRRAWTLLLTGTPLQARERTPARHHELVQKDAPES